MSAPRKDRLEARLASRRSVLSAALTGSAIAVSGNAAPMMRLMSPMRRLMSPVVAEAAAPSISAGGVVPMNGAMNTIQPGEWVSIYGKNLAAGTTVWNGDFPTSLGGTSVTINGRAAYLSMVSAGQINLQAPDDTATGRVNVVVTTAGGKATSTVNLYPYSPAFQLRAANYVAAIIVRSDGSGAYGQGGYDIAGPPGTCFGVFWRGVRTDESDCAGGQGLFGRGANHRAVLALHQWRDGHAEFCRNFERWDLSDERGDSAGAGSGRRSDCGVRRRDVDTEERPVLPARRGLGGV